ncbi:hypothetical protein LB579_32640 [Mesorhizobium sp. BR1-1-7]|uniref:hypothetical protein n=1 Tax=Mesorhizobium sp. BR1-1-7 TaxID=2876647 RepID=UPI001CCC4C32|nr:hypothetical protein [Mesorhizobium sp. BR1-1-7]MBZ9922414.1 hypothetical protein [Mesorhizobium sp. BR1-1-7]
MDKPPVALGATVVLEGVVVGVTKFQDRRDTYLVQFKRKGRSFEDWFFLEDLDVFTEQDGTGI